MLIPRPRRRIGRPRPPLPAASRPAPRYLAPAMPRLRKKGRLRGIKKVPRSDAPLPEYDRRSCPEGLVTRTTFCQDSPWCGRGLLRALADRA